MNKESVVKFWLNWISLKEPVLYPKNLIWLQIDVEKTALKTHFDTMKQTLQDDINTRASKNQLQNYVEKTALKTQFDTMKQTLQDDINTKASNTEVQSLKVSWFSNNKALKEQMFMSNPQNLVSFLLLLHLNAKSL